MGVENKLRSVFESAVSEKLSGSDESLGHLLKREGRESLAEAAGAALAERVKNDKLKAVAGGAITDFLSGKRVSGKQIFRTGLAMFLSRKGEF